MNLLAELTANAYQIDRRALGKRVTFAVEGEEAEERRLEQECALVYSRTERRRESARELVLAALRDGRARFSLELCEITQLKPDTIKGAVTALTRAGEVEGHRVAGFLMWSRTQPGETCTNTP